MLTLEPVFKSDDPKYLAIEADAQWIECRDSGLKKPALNLKDS